MTIPNIRNKTVNNVRPPGKQTATKLGKFSSVWHLWTEPAYCVMWYPNGGERGTIFFENVQVRERGWNISSEADIFSSKPPIRVIGKLVPKRIPP